jgi:hypothetical protein
MEAVSRSPLRTHSAVSFFIEYLASTHNFVQEPVPPAEPLFQNARRPHQQVEWEASVNGLGNANGLAKLIASWHDDE